MSSGSKWGGTGGEGSGQGFGKQANGRKKGGDMMPNGNDVGGNQMGGTVVTRSEIWKKLKGSAKAKKPG